MTQSRHKYVNLILRKCANYQEMGRPYTDKVGTNINMGRSMVDRTLIKKLDGSYTV